MKVLVIGSGGREDALCWKLAQSEELTKLYCAPGNPGTSRFAENVPIKVDDIERLVEFAKTKEIDLTVVGPELPLSLGVVDAFRTAGRLIVGPTQAAAQLESSKAFAKEILNSVGAPTAQAYVFTDKASLLRHVQSGPLPTVLKADGLASGKGVFVCETGQEVALAVQSLFDELRADRVVIEEFLTGKEASLIVATDGERIFPLAPSHDHKRLLDNNRGPNTGGMGTVSPTFHLTPAQEKEALKTIIEPVLRAMRERGTPFSGFLYAGLMISEEGRVSCLEFNTRLGDPECQVIMKRMKSDFLPTLRLLAGDRTLQVEPRLEWSLDAAVCVVLASAGYPQNPQRGDAISGLDAVQSRDEVVVFHAGTARREDGTIVTAGGRVLTVTGSGKSIEAARRLTYEICEQIAFEGMQFRRDIGATT